MFLLRRKISETFILKVRKSSKKSSKRTWTNFVFLMLYFFLFMFLDNGTVFVVITPSR